MDQQEAAVRVPVTGPAEAVHAYHRRRRPLFVVSTMMGLVTTLWFAFQVILVSIAMNSWAAMVGAGFGALVALAQVSIGNVANAYRTARMLATSTGMTILAAVVAFGQVVTIGVAIALDADRDTFPGIVNVLLALVTVSIGVAVRRTVANGLREGVALS
jgi:hypothetical protein